MMHDQILTIPEIAELLRIAEKTVYSLAQKGELPAFKVGGQWRFSRKAIQGWIEEQTGLGQRTGTAAGSAPVEYSGSSPEVSKKPRTRRRR